MFDAAGESRSELGGRMLAWISLSEIKAHQNAGLNVFAIAQIEVAAG